MTERTISAGASCFLVRDDSLTRGWHSPIYEWLKKEGFVSWGRKGTYYAEWIYINILTKVYAAGLPGISVTPVVGDHAITWDELMLVYGIFKKYEGFSVLKMTEKEQSDYEKLLESLGVSE